MPIFVRPKQGFNAVRAASTKVAPTRDTDRLTWHHPATDAQKGRPRRVYKEFAHAYTDGSKTNDAGAGSVVFFPNHRDSVSTGALRLPEV